ncbi:FkbM family methyltransferase [Nostoc sp. FACHB-87]|uniref:FkbM family methyltransferase n=1 Tax=Nostocaceae TaxID=1162 RepID=UPI0016834003|nr:MULTISPECIES: FkbM family methyltransferase [Nostocaceae]MBD2453550.1 FkbM family methyltransferase [Nostoc sp. FACHB-87]MBD2475675.1 FkbM family methyltransferase [Anabaena sp. FACHB-83]
MTFISYAQNFEDVLLNRVFKDKSQGFYIDIGALHPTVDSVTKAFYDRGWSGINIEPIKEYYNLFEQERIRDINLNVAISNVEGNLEFFQVVGDPGNSTCNQARAEEIAQNKGLEIYRYNVPVRILAQICQQYVNQTIDFLKIDVEGLEEKVIIGGNWEKFRPTLLIIETTLPGTNIRCKNDIPNFLIQNGYQQVFFDGINDYYIAEESNHLSKYFAFPVNILDNYVSYRFINQQIYEPIVQGNNQLENLITVTTVQAKLYDDLHKQADSSSVNQTEKIKIALDIAVLGLGTVLETAKTGVFRVTENLLKGLLKSPDCCVYLCTSSPDLFEACQSYINQNLEQRTLPLFQLEQLKYLNVDIYHSTYYPLPHNIYFATRIITLYDLIPILYPQYFNYNSEHIVKTIIEQIDTNDFVSCISESTKQDICAYRPNLNHNQVLVTHLAADQEKFYPCTDSDVINQVKQKYKIPNQPYLLTLSTLEPRKNIAHVIRAFLRLIQNQNIHDLNLVLVGTKGWQYEEIFAEIDKFQELKDRIIITGFVPDEDLAPLYSGALAFLYLSFYEGFGLPPLEAMQCGTPVITSNTSSLPEVVGDAGIMLDPNDILGIENNILRLYSEPALRENLAKKSLQQAQNFSWDKYIQETIKIYELAKAKSQTLPRRNILIDGVFFQLYQTGIARVWRSLLEQWSNSEFANHILVLDRGNTAPKINGIRYRTIPVYDYNDTDTDKQMLQEICDEEGADLFISSYYTTPLTTPSVFVAHDMIPEVFGWNLEHPMWREKHYAIHHATAYLAVSENTAKDLVNYFPEISLESIVIAQNGVEHQIFSPSSQENISRFIYKYGINKPYFILVGAGNGYKNGMLFFQAFSQLSNSYGFDIVCTGSGGILAEEFRVCTSGSSVYMLQLSDEELATAYSGAVALVYPSKYEGFGMPIVEAMACGCPVITCPNASIPEVAGEAAIYVKDDDVDGMVNALCDIQKPRIRQVLIEAGLAQAQKFSWTKMADIVSTTLINASLLSLKLKEINVIVFPDWSQSEELLGLELESVIKAIATYPDSQKTTLLINTSNISTEDAELLLSGITMNLLMEEDLDISEGLEIYLVGSLADIQWQALLPRLSSRIILEHEDKAVLAELPIETLPAYELENFINQLCVL